MNLGVIGLGVKKMTASEKRKEQMREMYAQGMNFTKIGEAFGISKQRVYQLIGGEKPYFIKITEKHCVYEGLRNWMNENAISIAKLTRAVCGCYHPETRGTISNALKGANTSKHTIDGILRVTGLTYEEAFGRGDVE